MILRQSEGSIATLILNRPEKRNALSRGLVAQLGDWLDVMAVEPGLRVLILRANGPTFCAGMDLNEATLIGTSAEEETRAVGDAQGIADLIDRVHRFPVPTIAVVEGDALAGGAGLALACDFVLMGETAHLGFPEVQRGLVAAIVMQDLVRQVGDRRARDLLLTGRKIDASEAERWGLVNRVVPAGSSCVDEARKLATALLASAPLAIQATKESLDDATFRPADLRGPAAVSAAVRSGDEAREGMIAFLEKRRPNWDLSG